MQVVFPRIGNGELYMKVNPRQVLVEDKTEGLRLAFPLSDNDLPELPGNLDRHPDATFDESMEIAVVLVEDGAGEDADLLCSGLLLDHLFEGAPVRFCRPVEFGGLRR